MLEGAGSPFVTKQTMMPEDIGVFLWILSPDYVPDPVAQEKFCERIAKIKIPDALEQIRDYLEMTFSDADTDEKERKTFANFIAYVIDMFANQYGWTVQTILNMPMRQVYQLSSVIGERFAAANGKKYTKLRAIDMLEAKAMLEAAKAAKAAKAS